jgi:hypothetical protein
MKRNAWVAAAVAASMLSAGSAMAESARVEQRAKVQNVRERAAASPSRRVVAFQTDRTDSWLCNNVSVFFCTSLIPSLSTGSSTTNNAASQVPDRSRKSNQ